jgi:glycine hydroxymethyltransferase
MGLIAGGQFQSPLEEGADVIISSTHKTLAGPQGGMILTNDKSIAERIGPAIAPLLVSNHHLGRLPALAATFLEWAEFGKEHAKSIVSNAKSLGQALENRGVPLVGSALGFTESHTLILMVNQFGQAKTLANQLEKCNIITGAVRLSKELGTHGLRLGVQEITRQGMVETDAPAIANCIVDALRGNLDAVKQQVIDLVKGFNQIRFTLNTDDEC